MYYLCPYNIDKGYSWFCQTFNGSLKALISGVYPLRIVLSGALPKTILIVGGVA